MPRKILIGILVLGLVFSVFCISVFAEEETGETFTITTYYPSPYGSYNQLEVYRGLTYKPLTSLPTTDFRQGEVVYVDTNPSDSKPGQFYFYGGGGWVAQGGNAGNVLYLACPWGSDAATGANKGWGNQCGSGGTDTNCCTPVACPSGWTSAGTFAEPVSVACPGANDYGGSSCEWAPSGSYERHPVAVGRTVRVCVKD